MSSSEDHLSNVLAGTVLGALAGCGLAWSVGGYIFDAPPLVTGGMIFTGALVGGVLGFFLGAAFIEWLSEYLWWFW
jgi:hypothetical protein